LGGKPENAAGSYKQNEPTAEEKMVLLEKEAYEKGFAQGEKDGFELGETKANKVTENIENLLDDMTRLKSRLVKRYEKDILETIFAIAKKVIHTHMQMEETAVRDTILEALKLTTEKRDIILKINPEDFEFVEKLRPELFSRHMNVKSIAITSDPTITRGGCLLETPSGDVDASIETQLDSLHQSLKDAYMS
jgi:flagellar assembly protein FliH